MFEKEPYRVSLQDLLQTQRAGAGGSWIREVRRDRQLQGKELAQRLGVSPARVSVLEKDEQRGAVTLRMMQKAAAALDCTFIYAFVPNAAPAGAKPRVRLDPGYMESGNEVGDTHRK